MNWTPKIILHRHRPPTEAWTYAQLDQYQRTLADSVRAGESGTILLSEVAPVITLGRRTPVTDLTMTKEALLERGISVQDVDRGGLATYHGPGQWVLFPVESVERLTGDPRGVKKAVCHLLNAACSVVREFDPEAEVRAGEFLGVWGPRGKYVSLGVHVEQGVLLHGIALNVLRTPESFLGLRPCGADSQPAFLAEAAPGVIRDDRVFQGIGQHLVREVVRVLGASRGRD